MVAIVSSLAILEAKQVTIIFPETCSENIFLKLFLTSFSEPEGIVLKTFVESQTIARIPSF